LGIELKLTTERAMDGSRTAPTKSAMRRFRGSETVFVRFGVVVAIRSPECTTPAA
jgi:hypothetical protein